MNSPSISIIMPAYNQERYIAEAITSVCNQCYTDWELVIVDDGSTDNTGKLATGFIDPRIHYVYQPNRGASAARNRGMEIAQGNYIAFLDADDLYLPNKLELQFTYMEQHPEVGLSYGGRIEIDEVGTQVGFFMPPTLTTLSMLVLSFPFAPTDLIVRRSWLQQVGGFSSAFVVNEDRDLYIRLALAGCHCVGLEQILTCRRLDTQKTFRDLPAKLNDMLRSLQTAFTDPRCPADVLVLRNQAISNIYLSWAYQAAIQQSTTLAGDYFREWLHHVQTWNKAVKHEVLDYLVHAATRDGGDHETRLQLVLAQLPPELAELTQHAQQLVARGYVKRGMLAVLWGRSEAGYRDLERARQLGAKLDDALVQELTQNLLGYESIYGTALTETVLLHLKPGLAPLDDLGISRKLYANLSINRAFKAYRLGQYDDVPGAVLHGLTENYRYMMNRGVAAIFFRSIAHMYSTRTWPIAEFLSEIGNFLVGHS